MRIAPDVVLWEASPVPEFRPPDDKMWKESSIYSDLWGVQWRLAAEAAASSIGIRWFDADSG